MKPLTVRMLNQLKLGASTSAELASILNVDNQTASATACNLKVQGCIRIVGELPGAGGRANLYEFVRMPLANGRPVKKLGKKPAISQNGPHRSLLSH